MTDRRSVSIPADLSGERADKIVAVLAGVSRQTARQMIESEANVSVDGRPVAADQRVDGGVLDFPILPAEAGLVPEKVPFTVVFADDDLVVVDKPAGVVVHPGAGQSGGTLAAGLLARFPEIEGVGQPGRWGLIHRLDKETSGLLLVARNRASYERLVADLAARRIKRQYLALVHGEMAMPTGSIDAPIGRDPTNPTRQRIASDGRPARTHYLLVGTAAGLSLLELTLETGRTHQIRVHLAAIDHPVVGDRTYSRKPDPFSIRRQFLHARKLELLHPVTGQGLAFEAPLPPVLAGILQRIGILQT
ncbi:MAG: RluA family pseudouridine synthase [Actinomycetota bacterium]|nr:RluA family pseudouridine synthase [Actinomycetota bacterium]